MKTLIAQWKSKSGKWYADLYQDDYGYGYCGNNCGGSLAAKTEAEAIAEIENRNAFGWFQPDMNKTPLKRVM